MSKLQTLFSTCLYQTALATVDIGEIAALCQQMAVDDEAGLAWCAENAYPGYTSYASLNDLPWRFPAFKALEKLLDKHVAAFAKSAAFDLGEARLKLDSLWVNVLEPGGFHASHIHPHSVVSGTFYVSIPPGSSAIRFEDPRLAMMMAAPPRRKDAPAELKPFIDIAPTPGTLLLWESWLRHEVRLNEAEDERISVSFNYRWG